MNQDDVLRLAREAGFKTGLIDMGPGIEPQPFALPIGVDCLPELQRFAELVAADVLERCEAAASAHLDLKEEERAVKAAQDSRGSEDDEFELNRLRHASDVQLYNAGIRKCIASIRALMVNP